LPYLKTGSEHKRHLALTKVSADLLRLMKQNVLVPAQYLTRPSGPMLYSGHITLIIIVFQ